MLRESTVEKILTFATRIEGIDLQILQETFDLVRLHRQMEHCIENELAGIGLNVRQVNIMETLYHNCDEIVTPADLSDEVHLTRSAMTSALDSLENLGYVSRRQHPSDRRMIAITLTTAGRKHIENYLPERYRRLTWFTNHLSSSERKTMLRVYGKLIELFTAEARGEKA